MVHLRDKVNVGC